MKEYLIIIRSCPLKLRSDDRGVALLLTLLVTVVLTVVILEFNYMMRVHATLSGNLVEELKAEVAAEAGIESAKALLLNDIQADSNAGFYSDSLDEDWAEETTTETPALETRTVISDEMSKLNLNRLMESATADAETEAANMYMVENVRRLFELLEIDPNLVYGILDWIDENDEPQLFGAESEYYESLEPPVVCKNGKMDKLEELLFIEGFDKEILYGDEDTFGLSEFLTICGDDNGLVNVNTAPEEVIAAVLNSDSLASMVVEMRDKSPFKDSEDMVTRVPDVDLSAKFTTQSLFFNVRTTASVLTGGKAVREKKLKALLKRTKERGDSGEDLFRIDTISWETER